MVAPITGGMTVGQASHARSIIRLLKTYLDEKNDGARKQIALAVKNLSNELAEMPNAGFPPPSAR